MSNKDTINRYILEGIKNGNMDKDMSLLILKEINRNREAARDEIAIIGIGCKLPCAENADEYWFNLKNGAEVIRDFPESRAKDIGKSINMKAGWLENIAGFDAGFFRISPKEALSMHPSQRLFLEKVWETLEDAGYANDGIYGSNTGVYVGIDHMYQMEYTKMVDQQDILMMTGSMTSVLASRISYILNLHGPNLVVDTACSSGLVATHLACRALKNKECDMAVAGGLNLLRQFNADFDGVESVDGRLCAFDKNSKGTVWGEGLGFVLLKPLEKAIRDRDNIYAVIKGTAIRNDGTTNGITAPSAEMQAETIVKAWEDAGIDPETISYIEGHVTGTVLGDPIEVKGLKTAFEKYTDKKQFCGIGTVKPNIGHGISAAGVSALLKVILSMKNGQIPPNINFSEPNPFIDFFDSPIYVNDKLKEWETGNGQRRAGVSSFGFSRTNCHVVLEEAPPWAEEEVDHKGFEIFTLSARSENALKQYIKRYGELVNACDSFSLKDICHTANTGRMHYSCRIVMLLRDKQDFIQKIKRLNEVKLNENDDTNIFYGEHRVVSDNMKQNLAGEITKSEKKAMERIINGKLEQLGSLLNEELKKELDEICSMYVKGANVNWKELYKNDICRRISLPTYPFEHKNYWMNQQEAAVPSALAVKDISHPLLDRCLVSTLDQEVYLTEFSVERHWVLTEHIIMDLNVVTGTTYLEMAREAGKKLYGDIKVEFRDVIFLAPLVVGKVEPKEVHTIVRKEDGHIIFKIVSKSRLEDFETDIAWVVHAEGEIYPYAAGQDDREDLESLRERCCKKELVIDMSVPMEGFHFGPRWRNISKILLGEGEIFTELKINEDYIGDINEFVLHPSLLDNSVNMAIEKLIHDVEEGMYLPLSYKSFKVYRPIPAKFYSYQKINSPLIKGMQTVSLDVKLIGEQGEAIADIQGYVIKKVKKHSFRHAEGKKNTEQYHTIGWVPSAAYVQKAAAAKVLVFKDEKGIADSLIARLKAGGKKVVEAVFGKSYACVDEDKYIVGPDEASYKKLIGDIKERGITQIIHMMSIMPESEVDSPEALEDRMNRGVYSLFYLTRAVMKNKLNKNLDVVTISEYVNEVTKREIRIYPHNAPVFAFSRVAGNEYGGISFRSVDIDNDTTAGDLLHELSVSGNEFITAYREGKRYVEEFGEFDAESAPASSVEIKETGIYLITGGIGGIGLEAAKYLASKNKVNIALVNRSKLPEMSCWDSILKDGTDKKLCSRIKAIREIEGAGAKVVCYSSDVSSSEDMKKLTDELRAAYGRINGIVHSAGVAGEGLIVTKDEEKFRNVLAPKISGTWLLDRFTKEDRPDFFIMFSSILSMIGIMGQSDYASANSYLDSFAAYRNKNGGKTATINWTVWNETGMAKDYNMDQVRGLFKAITNSRGMDAFDMVVNREVTRLVAGELDYERISHSEGGLGINLSQSLKTKVEKRCARIKSDSSIQDKKQQAKLVIKGEDGANEIETKIAGIWAEVLALEEVSLFESFNELGGDSIIAASLLKAIDKVFPDMLDISDIFTYPTIKLMAAQIEKKLGRGAPENKKVEPGPALSTPNAEIEEIMKRLARGEISAAEAENLIEKSVKTKK